MIWGWGAFHMYVFMACMIVLEVIFILAGFGIRI